MPNFTALTGNTVSGTVPDSSKIDDPDVITYLTGESAVLRFLESFSGQLSSTNLPRTMLPRCEHFDERTGEAVVR